MKKKVTIINKNGIPIEVSEETAKLMSDFDNKVVHESLIHNDDKNIAFSIKNESLSISEQIFYIEMLSELRDKSRPLKENIANTLAKFYSKEDGEIDFITNLKKLKPVLNNEVTYSYELKNILDVINTIIETHEQNSHIQKGNEIKYTAKQLALTYLFELDHLKEKLPILYTGELNKKELIKIGFKRLEQDKNRGIVYKFKTSESFYDAINKIYKEPRNDLKRLNQISINWRNDVINLTILDKEKITKHIDTNSL